MTERDRPGDLFDADDPASGFLTDQEPVGGEPEATVDVLGGDGAGAAVILDDATGGAARADLTYLAQRPAPGTPREYRFPAFERSVLANGMTLLSAHLPGRPLLMAQLMLDGGAGSEPADAAGVTVLAARGLTEGTEHRDAIELIEASERLGADLHADAGWETVGASVEVPRSRFGPALELLAEMVLRPAFPADELARLRDERLNDLLQARADPRRRIERVFPEVVYAASSPFARPLAGTEATVPRLDRAAVVARYAALLDPSRATLIVAGDLAGVPVIEAVEAAFAGWRASTSTGRAPLDATPHPDGRRIVLVDRPGSPQSEVRVGHVALPRATPDFHAVSVLNSILGGLFNSRLQRLLREERGYTYGVQSAFELRRSAGPFVVRTAVQTEVTVPAVRDILDELRRIREAPVDQVELDEARDYLIGVFPLRFEAPPQVVAALAGLVSFGLPDDELDRYRPAIAAVSADDVLDVARRHVRPEDASIVIVGDIARFEAELRSADLAPIVISDEPGATAAAA